MFRTAVWRKTRDSCLWHYVWKTVNLCSEKVVLTVFTEMFSASFFLEIKYYCSQRNSVGTDRENIFPGNLWIMKANARYTQKPSFLSKNIYLYNLWYLAALKTLNTRGEVLYFKWKLTLSKTTKSLSMSLFVHQKWSFSLFHLLDCFWHVPASSSLLWLFSASFHFLQATTSQRMF